MDLLNKLTIKNLKLNKKRTIVTIIGIMLSVALITAVASVYTSGTKSLIKYEADMIGDFHVAYFDVDKKDLSVISNNKAIKDFYLVKNVGYSKIDSKNDYKPYAYIKSFNKKALESLSVNLVEGRMPENSNEILVPLHLKTNGRLEIKVGEELTLEVGNRELDGTTLNQFNPYQDGEQLVDTTSHKYKVVGITERPANNIEGYEAPGYTFITYGEDIDDGLYDVYTKYNKQGLKKLYEVTGNILGVDGIKFDKCMNEFENMSKEELDACDELTSNIKYNTTANEYLIALETNPLKSDMVTGLETFVIIIVIIIIVTSVFCIKNSFDISITEKIKQYGMLKSIGSTQKQIKKNVYYEATILGLFGIPLGVLLGFLASFILMIISNLFVKDLIQVDLSFSFSWLATLAAIVLGVVTVYLSALSSARKASKVSPIESIRNSGSIKINPKKIKSPKFINKIFGVGGVISYKNLKRNKKKYRTTVISIIVSVFTFVALSSFMDIIFRSIKEDFQTTEFNLSVFIQDPDSKTKNIVNNLLDDTVIESSYTMNDALFMSNIKTSREYKELDPNDTATEYYTNIIGLGDKEYREYLKKINVKYDDVKDKVILVDSIKIIKYDDSNKRHDYSVRRFDYKKGDIIDGVVNKNINDKNISVTIGYVTSERPFGYELNNRQPHIVMHEELFNKYIESYTSDTYIKCTDPNKLQDSFDNALKDYTYEIYNVNQNYKMMNNLYTLVSIFMYGFIIVISLIGITNIFNTITTNMELRKREFAMLKSVGMTKKEFNRMIRLESMFMGFKSLSFGIVFGVAISYAAFKAIDQDILTYQFPIKGIIISIVVVLLLISLIMKYSISKINKQNTIETIRNENI
nr:ABC transporter permease [Bacilli bacterium]